MKICTFLHFYQPHNQQPDILDRIVNECYRPLLNGLLENKTFELSINISGGLTELLAKYGYNDVIDSIKKLLARGQIEISSSAMYHAFLPLLPRDEISRQIKINEETNKTNFGELYAPSGFFSPEMAVNDLVLDVIKEHNFNWVLAPEMAYSFDNTSVAAEIYTDSKSKLNVFFRNKRVSSLILSGVCRTAADLINETRDIHNDTYWLVVMDAETFGHHRIGHEKFLFEILGNDFFEPCKVSSLLENLKFSGVTEKFIDIRPSTWTNEEQDFWLDDEKKLRTTDKSFILWKDPENPIHTLQWEMVSDVFQIMKSYENKDSAEYEKARHLLDTAIASDQFWWASAKPWWSLEMVEQGAYQLKEVVSTLKPASQNMLNIENNYRKILDQAFEWQRNGYIRNRHLKNSSTYLKQPFKNRAPEEWYNQIVLEFEDQMNISAGNKDYEKAIKWRDALIKLKSGTDIYDVLHVVDELWTARTIPSVKPIMKHEWNELSDFAKQFFIGLSDEHEFNSKKSE